MVLVVPARLDKICPGEVKAQRAMIQELQKYKMMQKNFQN